MQTEYMMSKPTRALVEMAALLGSTWLWITIYQSFAHTGLWRAVDTALRGSATMPGQAVVILLSLLIGWLLLATVTFSIWCVLLRGRVGADCS